MPSLSSDPQATGLAPRLVAWRVLEAVADGAYADLALERELKRQPLPPRDRALATELAYGAIRQRRCLDLWLDRYGKVPAAKQPPRLRWLLHIGLQQLLHADRVPTSAAVSTAVELAKRQRLANLAPVVNGLLRAVARAIAAGESLPMPMEPRQRLAVEHSLPDWLVNELWERIGPERTADLAAASNRIPSLDLRINPLRTTVEAQLQAFADAGVAAAAIEGLPQGISLSGRPGALTQLPGFGDGHWCVQDRSAQRIVPLLALTPGLRVLDACAAPGGKSTHIAELMCDQGEVVALDVTPSRLRQVQANVQRLGLNCIKTEAADATDLEHLEPGCFDRVLLDVPCSGLGTLARHVDARWSLRPDVIEELTHLQAQLLDQGARLTAPGGRLVYATCTVHPAENRSLVEAFLADEPSWQLQESMLELWPSPDQPGDGFFAAVLTPPG